MKCEDHGEPSKDECLWCALDKAFIELTKETSDSDLEKSYVMD